MRTRFNIYLLLRIISLILLFSHCSSFHQNCFAELESRDASAQNGFHIKSIRQANDTLYLGVSMNQAEDQDYILTVSLKTCEIYFLDRINTFESNQSLTAQVLFDEAPFLIDAGYSNPKQRYQLLHETFNKLSCTCEFTLNQPILYPKGYFSTLEDAATIPIDFSDSFFFQNLPDHIEPDLHQTTGKIPFGIIRFGEHAVPEYLTPETFNRFAHQRPRCAWPIQAQTQYLRTISPQIPQTIPDTALWTMNYRLHFYDLPDLESARKAYYMVGARQTEATLSAWEILKQ